MNKPKRIILVTLALLYVSLPIAAKEETWERITVSPNGETVYIDAAAITTGAAGSKEAWFRCEYNPPNCTLVENQCITEITEHRRLFDDKTACSLFTFAAFTDASFATHNFSCKPEPIQPGSVSEAMWRRVYR